MSYAGEHASAYADVLAAGTSLAVSRSAQTESSNGALGTPTRTSIAIAAFAKASDPVRLRELGLTLDKALTLFVCPETFPLQAYTDEFIKPLDTLPWNGVTFTVRAVGPLIQLDGNVIAGTIVASI